MALWDSVPEEDRARLCWGLHLCLTPPPLDWGPSVSAMIPVHSRCLLDACGEITKIISEG